MDELAQKGSIDLAITKGIKIQSNILRKIQQLAMPSGEASRTSAVPGVCRAICSSDQTNSGISKSIRNIENSTEKAVNVWKVNESVVIIGETSNSRTEYFTRKNNIDHAVSYLDELYGDKYVVYTFRRSSISKSFKRSVLYDQIDFSLDLALEISQTCKFFLDNRKGSILVVEMKGGCESIVLFLVSCILSYCKFYWCSEAAFNALSSSNPLNYTFQNTGTVLRYARYFDQAISFRSLARFPKMILNQAIVTTIPTVLSGGNFRPVLSVKSRHQESVFSLEKCYRDDNFLIFSSLDVEIFEDARISLYFEQERKQCHVLNLSFNTLFYQQGLYRFGRSEIETSLPQDSIYRFFKEDFYIDLVLIENKGTMTRSSLLKACSLLETMRIVTERFFSDYDESRARTLRSKGYNSTLAIFCAQMHFSEADSDGLYRMLLETGHKSLAIRSHVQAPATDEPVVVLADEAREFEFKADVIDYGTLYEDIGDLEVGDLCLLEEDLPIKKGPVGKHRSKLFSKRIGADPLPRVDVYVKRPFHWTTIKHIGGTFFDEMAGTDSVIDYGFFEECFCSPAEAVQRVEVKPERGRNLIDPKRLFLAALAIKSLELNHITPENLGEILQNRPQDLSYEDLSNIVKALPENESEASILNGCLPQDLGTIETSMLKLSEIPEVSCLVEILRFERVFFEEVVIQQRIIEGISSLLTKILESGDFKRVLKLVLDIGNTVNYKYGRSRRPSEGFRVESLLLLNGYHGKHGRTLIEFVLRAIEQNGIDLAGLEESLKEIHSVKNEDIHAVRAKINELIIMHREISRMCGTLDHYDREKYRKLAAYAYKGLSRVSSEYKKCIEKCCSLKIKLGEEDKTPISYVLASISDFLLKIKAERQHQHNTG